MDIRIRPISPADAKICAEICYEAFRTIAAQHNFPSEIPSLEVANDLLSDLVTNPGFYGIVAELDGRIAGSAFVDERCPIAGVCAVSVNPAVQNRAIGRHLMQQVLERVAQRCFPGVRLVQTAYHTRSLSLYTKLGFEPREPLSIMQGPSLKRQLPGSAVRTATDADVDACNQVCLKVHGHEREGEVREALQQGNAAVVAHRGRITGYTTGCGFFGHAVGETNEDLKALIGAAPEFPGVGFLLPTRNGELLRWCLQHGLRVVQPMTLMSIGLYNEPMGAFLPSIIY